LSAHSTYFSVTAYSVTTDRSQRGKSHSRAEVSLRIGTTTVRRSATGVGPVHALDEALRACLRPLYPEIERVQLVDYRVGVVGATRGTGADVQVTVTATDALRTWDAGCTSSNVVDASFEALCASLVMGIMHAQPKVRTAI
jgi:2-isopropylmalate synthase